VTEDEAKTKVCCGPTVLHPNTMNGCCVGSACMAWRWALEYYRDPDATDPTKYRSSAADGYCGLAGVPTC
jgi:hypothetical protein